jgi:uncharacterized alkaline shock family protein YloU
MVEKKRSKAAKQPEPNPAFQENHLSMQDEYIHGDGTISIAPDVLVTISRLAATETPGVSRMSSVPGPVSRFRRGGSEGVELDIQGDFVTTDLYIVVKSAVNLREVSRNVQRNVTRAISEMVGMQVGRVNIHIEDIDFPEE